MKFLLLVLFYMEEILAAPMWLEGLRTGNERFKLQNGTTTLFRQLGQTCEIAFKRLEEDLEREYNMLVKYTTEIVYEDDLGCGITVSVGKIEKIIKEDVQKILIRIGKDAADNAYTGLTYKQFNKLVKHDSPILIDSSTLCLSTTGTSQVSIHGPVQVCWKEGLIAGFCVPQAGTCFKKRY